MPLPLSAARSRGVVARAALSAVALGASAVAPSGPVAAQVAPPAPASAMPPAPAAPVAALTLDEAIGLARRNSPAYLQTVNTQRRADAAVRVANGALFPSLSTNFGSTYREGRPQFFAGQTTGAQSDQISSSVGLDAQATYNVAALNALKSTRISSDATRADVRNSEAQVRRDVTIQYLTALQSQSTAALQDSLIRTATAQLELARARVAVGSATPLDVKRAEVALGQQRVLALQARQQLLTDRATLFRTIGIPIQQEVSLTSRFALDLPNVDVAALADEAVRRNPALEANRLREQAATLDIKSARGQYLPSLSIQAGVSGFANRFMNTDYFVSQALGDARGTCQSQGFIRQTMGQPFDPSTCNAITLSPSEIAAARSRNGSLTSYSRNPYSVSAFLSLPIFNNFQREQQVQQAIAARNDAEYRRRQQELQIRNDMELIPQLLRTTREVVAVQAQNAATAQEALQLAGERYRVGLGTFLDVSQARDDYARAQTSYINAVYDYHRAIANFEFSLGRPLR